MLLFRDISQFSHLTDDRHLGRHLHQLKVVDGSLHTRRVGIIGIHYQVVMFRDRHLRAVVGGDIVLQGVVNLLEGDIIDISDGDGSEHVVKVIGTNQMGLHLHPLTRITGIMVLFPPAELQEGRTADDLAMNQDIGVVTLTIIIDIRKSVSHFHQVLVVAVDENRTLMSSEEVIKFPFCLADTLKGAEAQQVGASHIGNQSASGLCRLDQCLDVARMRGTHLHNGNIVVLVQAE